jgi:non-heme chloroperoxidase
MKMKITLVMYCLFAFSTAGLSQKSKFFDPCLSSQANENVAPLLKTLDLSTSISLEYVEQGCPDGIPVILLHGFTDSWHSYEMILPYLPTNLHVYAISMRGHGNSAQPITGYHPDDFAGDIAAFIKELGIYQPVIAGHSMGSTIAQSFAVKYPELTRGIILAGSFANYNTAAVLDFKAMIDQLTDPIDRAFAEGFQRGTAVRPVPEEMMKIFIDETSKVPAYVWKGVASGWSTSNYYNKLDKFNKPALIIWGDKDGFCTKADQDLLNRSLKGSTLKIYEGTGHAIHWEEPQRFATDITEFITGIQ